MLKNSENKLKTGKTEKTEKTKKQPKNSCFIAKKSRLFAKKRDFLCNMRKLSQIKLVRIHSTPKNRFFFEKSY